MRSVYTKIFADKIFGMVGRCGSGPNTRWLDWSDLGRKNKALIEQEYMRAMNAYCSHYIDLESDILKNGFIDPIIVSYPRPSNRLNYKYIPPELLNQDLFFLDSFWGASRLWVAQKHNMHIPCIVNDQTNTIDGQVLDNPDLVKSLFSKKPDTIYFKNNMVHIRYIENNFIGSHINKNIQTQQLKKYRENICGTLLSKYGYDNPFINTDKTTSKIINFYCVYKQPDKQSAHGVKSYSLKYVEKLHEGIINHSINDYRVIFKCLSDHNQSTTPLKYNWPGWWSKMELFRPDIKGDILYMDLDTIIYDNLKPIYDICHSNPFPIMLSNLIPRLASKAGCGSGVMWLPEKYRGIVWNKWIKNPSKIMEKYSLHGDQKFISDTYSPILLEFQKIKPKCIVSYKIDCKGSVPKGASVICYHGNPRPHETNWANHS